MKSVLFFTQKSCAPCRKIEPSVIALCKQYGANLQYIQVDTKEGLETAQKAGEISTPVCIVLDDNGNELNRLRNAQTILDGLPSLLQKDNTPSVSNGRNYTAIGATAGYAVSKNIKGLLFGAIIGDLANPKKSFIFKKIFGK